MSVFSVYLTSNAETCLIGIGEGLSIPHPTTGSWHRKILSVVSHYLKYFPVRSTSRIFPAEAQNSAKYTKVSEVFSSDTANYFSTGQRYILNYLQIIKNVKNIKHTDCSLHL